MNLGNMIELWVEFPWLPKRKKKSGSKFTKWILGGYLIVVFILVGLPLFLAFLWYLNTTDDLVNYYSYTLFPQIGAVKLEEQYKKSFDDSISTMDKANNLLTNAPSVTKSSADQEQEVDTLHSYFNQRDKDYHTMLSLDKKALSLNLPAVYKTFYQERFRADTMDYNAFLTYRTGQEKMMTAVVDMSIFEDSYDQADNEFNLVSQHVSQSNIQTMKDLLQQATIDYQKIAGDADTTGNFSQGVLDYIQRQYDFIGIMRQMIDGLGTNNIAEQRQAIGMLTQEESNPLPNVADIMSEWQTDMLFPYVAEQDAMHKKAWVMYSDTYAYAKSQHLYTITSIWENNLPTADKEYSPKSTSQYSS